MNYGEWLEHPQESGEGWPTSSKPRLGPGCLGNIDELLSRQPLGPLCPVGLQVTGISPDGPGVNPDKLDGSAPEIFHRVDWRQESGPLEPISEPQWGAMPAGHGKTALAGL